MIRRKHILFGIIFLCAIAITFSKTPLASSQGVSLVAGWVDGELPVEDTNSSLWQQTTAVEIPLSAQNVAKPILLDTKIKSVTARALQNASQIAILVEWADSTQDDSSVAMQDFRDAVALQFPLAEGQPFYCMGQQGGNVNLWHWKADWQADITARKEMENQYPNMYVDYYPYAEAAEGMLAGVADYNDQNYLPAQKAGNLLAAASLSSPVEDLIAGGFGSLTSQPVEGQNVQGFGEWNGDRWQIIFSREMSSEEQDDISFSPGKTYSIAFAVWDGANEERNGQKSTSQWVSLQLTNLPKSSTTTDAETTAPQGLATTQNITYLIYGVFALLIIAGAIIYIRLPE